MNDVNLPKLSPLTLFQNIFFKPYAYATANSLKSVIDQFVKFYPIKILHHRVLYQNDAWIIGYILHA